MLKNSKTNALFFCIVFCLLIGCKEEKQIVSFVHFERKADTIQLDLSLSNKNLIKFLEKEKQINFCDNKFRIGTFDLDNKVCFFPIIIGKYCDTDPLNHNIVDIETNQDHQILVESELVQNDKGLKKEILKHSIERFNAKNYKGLFYNFYWDVHLDEETNKENLVEVLKGIDLVFDYKANELFGKPIKRLNSEELIKMNLQFYAFLMISDNKPFVTPLPEKIEIEE